MIGQCIACGKTFWSIRAEAKHRHNFPALCKRNKQFIAWENEVVAEVLRIDQETDK